ncbi:erythromycin esterase [Kalaharituber pfeilii]|nr:erythromycin esterase [Kalaharituber pfeilii]
MATQSRVTDAVTLAHPEAVDPIVDFVKSADVVLLGEGTHGTQEFYQTRAAITRQLIEKHGFEAVATEADWPDSYRASRYAVGCSNDKDAAQALNGFYRFPQWMWRNTVIVELIEWLARFNTTQKGERRAVGFYGLDLYSLNASREAVLEYLDKIDPEAAGRARKRYECFGHAQVDPQRYGYEAAFGIRKSCKESAVAQLVELAQHTQRQLDTSEPDSGLAAFYAEQNARVVRDAELYYRTMFQEDERAWNVRDRHMMETLERLVGWLRMTGTGKVVVWAHNSHLGDARATEMGKRGQLSLGQLVREKWGDRSKNIGFTTYTGTVLAASRWGGPDRSEVRAEFTTERLERAIGVIYLPQTERASHYFYANLPSQFDAVVHFGHTTALQALPQISGAESMKVVKYEHVLLTKSRHVWTK